MIIDINAELILYILKSCLIIYLEVWGVVGYILGIVIGLGILIYSIMKLIELLITTGL